MGWLLALAAGWGQVESERVLVLYPHERLAEYARRVLLEAEAALAVLDPLFGPRQGRVVVRIDDSTDVFNAYATPLPRRTVELLAPAPAGGVIDLRTPSISYLILVHELTHAQQLTFRELPGGRLPPRLGLVLELSAPMPPAWFVEGIATYMESRFTSGGRLDWAYTQGLINALLEGDRFPDLAEMGLYTYRDWPGGQTRYLLGVRFVHHLIEKHGWKAVLETLRQYNTGVVAPPSFAAAWKRANGGSLTSEWRDWVGRERRRSAAYAGAGRSGFEFVAKGRDPAFSPDGGRIAYWNEGFVWVADRDGSGARRLAPVHPQRIWWADENTLIYSRYFREGDGVASDIFALDVASGRETRLTRGRHALLAAPAPGGCAYFVRERAGEAATLGRWCAGKVETIWRAPEGEHLLELAVSPEGRVALSVSRDGAVDLALLEAGRLRYPLPGRIRVSPPADPPDPCAGGGGSLGCCYRRNGYQHLRPLWDGEEALLFTGDERGVFDLYRLEPASGRVTRLGVFLGGAVGVAAHGGAYLVSEPGPDGYNINRIRVAEEDVAVVAPEDQAGPGSCSWQKVSGDARSPDRDESPLRPRYGRYVPWSSLKPYGWLPTGFSVHPRWPYVGFEASVYGLDDSQVYSYRAAFGYDPVARGLTRGAYAYLETGVAAGVDLLGPTAPLGFTLRAGTWPAAGEIVFGVIPGLASAGSWDRWSWRAGLQAGPVWSAGSGWRLGHAGFVRAARAERDAWGYLTRGGYGGVFGGNGYLWGVAGAAREWRGFPLVLEGRVIGGAAAAPLVGSVPLGDAVAVEARVRYGVETRWRSEDGWLALERVTVAPGIHGRYEPAGGRLGYGASLGVYADTALFYFAPLPLGVRGGWDGGWWWRLELGAW